MKKIKITFFAHGTEVASVSGNFQTLPGEASITWSGDLKPYVLHRAPAAYADVMNLTTHYAEQFEEAMIALANQCGLNVTIEQDGEWLVLEE